MKRMLRLCALIGAFAAAAPAAAQVQTGSILVRAADEQGAVMPGVAITISSPALVDAKVPGLVMSRPDVGGTSGGLQGTFSARGTASAQNTSFLNGINVGDPAAIGAAGFYYDFDAFDDIQVSTGAHDITVPTSGVFLNMITKTGGNKWNGSTTFTWLNDSTQGRNDTDPTLQKYGFRPDSNTSDFVSDINVAAGGPLVANKLRFF